MKLPARLACTTCCLLAIASPAVADTNQNFETWTPITTTKGTYTNAGWVVGEAIVYSAPKKIGAYAAQLMPWGTTTTTSTNATITTPSLLDGVGRFVFSVQNGKVGQNYYQVLTSANRTTWQLRGTYTNSSSTAWTVQTNTFNEYDTRYVRIRKTGDNVSGLYLSVDDIQITYPPAKVTFSSLTTEPDVPYANDPVYVKCDIAPSTRASNVTAKVYWGEGLTGPVTNQIAMSKVSGNTYRTSSAIPGKPGGTTIRYYVKAEFQGPSSLSPLYYDGVSTTSSAPSVPAKYVVGTRAFRSDYYQDSMVVTGAFNKAMLTVNDYEWETVYAAASVSNPSFRFSGLPTNGSPRVYWGDNEAPSLTLPRSGTAEISGSNISLTGTYSGQISLRFNESTRAYLARRCAYQDFSTWTTAGYAASVSNGWVVTNAYLTTDSQRKLRDGACYLNSNTTSFVRSPALSDGIGEISFWYRNWQANATPLAAFHVQKSKTGGNAAGEWATIATVSGISATNYIRYTARLNDRAYRYVRVLNSTNAPPRARLCLDEVLITDAGAGVVLTNLTSYPDVPTLADPVRISVQVQKKNGASNVIVTNYYRSGTSGSWTAVRMSTADGVTYTNMVPAAKGGTGGAGTVQYYVQAWWEGFESEYGRPVASPEGGAANPKSYNVRGAWLTFGTPTLIPAAPAVNDPVSVDATITPGVGASNITSVTLYYSIETGGWSSIAMSSAGGSHYVTSGTIPGQSTPGTRVNYYLRASYQGPGAISPTNYPAAGSAGPLYYIVRQRTDYYESSMVVTGSVNKAMVLTGSYEWDTVYAAASLSNPSVRFSGLPTNGNPRVYWGDNEAPSLTLPRSGTAEVSGSNISLTGTYSGQISFRFNESTRAYLMRRCAYQDFSAWTTAGYTSSSVSDGWVVTNAYLTTDALRQLRDGACYLSSVTGATAFVRSPALSEGIGEISFWYRNWQTNGAPAAAFHVQKSKTGGNAAGEWTTVATVSGVSSTKYLRHTTRLNDRAYRYVRILNSTNTPRPRLCLDEVLVTYAGSSVALTNLTSYPDVPTLADPVRISVQVQKKNGASNVIVTNYYRSGTSGSWTAARMSTADGVTYTNMVPAAKGGTGGAGTVQYYVQAWWDGVESEYGRPVAYPEGGSANPKSYNVRGAWVSFGTPAIYPSYPVTDSPVGVDATITPGVGASNISATLYYRIAGGGWGTLPMPSSGGNHYATTSGMIPAQSVPGTRVDYYVRAAYQGPGAVTPTNYPAGGSSSPFYFLFRQRALYADQSNMVVNATTSYDMRLIADHLWQAVTPATTLNNYAFRFRALRSGSTLYWSDTNAPATTLPLYGTAEETASSPILMSGVNNGHFYFRLNETNRTYFAHRCAYLDLNNMAAPAAFGTTYTNSEGWVLADTRTTTNTSPDDVSRVFAGRSAIMDSDAQTQSVRSPYLTNGVGEISFWYRNWETNATQAGKLVVQVAKDASSAWKTVGQVTNVLSMDYLHYEVSVSDQEYHLARVLNSTNTPRSRMCLDDVVVTDTGAGVLFSSLMNSPASPTIVNSVTVSVTITPFSGATNLAATLRYRCGNSGEYDEAAMTKSGNLFTGVVPPGAVGLMQYYVACNFNGFLSEATSPSYSPSLNKLPSPRGYTNSVSWQVTQNFETWTPITLTKGTYTNGNWVVGEGCVAGSSPLKKIGLYAGQLVPWGNPPTSTTATNSTITSPLLPQGAGSIVFSVQNSKSGTTYYDLWTSPDMATWQNRGSYACSSSTAWNTITNIISETGPVYVRIRKKSGDTAGSMYLGVDEIKVSHAATDVVFPNLYISPGYPNEGQPVTVTCEIRSKSEAHPAFDVQAVLYYWQDGSGPTNAAAMTKNGYRFSATIPGTFAARKTVKYYVQSTFKGFYMAAAENRSPARYPATAPAAFNYYVRPFSSDFSAVNTLVSNVTVTASQMLLISNEVWQTIVDFGRTGAANPRFSLAGFSRFTGTNYLSGVETYGEAAMVHSNLPLAGTLQVGAPAIALAGTYKGQYVLRYDESTGAYTLRECAYQDFDDWVADDTKFVDSLTKPVMSHDQNFDTWTVPAYGNIFDDFLIWPWIYPDPPFSWPSGLTPGYVGWVIDESLVITQVVSKAVRLKDEADHGYVRQDRDTWSDGLGKLSFDFRCVKDDWQPTLYTLASGWTNSVVEFTLRSSALPKNASGNSWGYCHLSVFTRYQDADNFYELKIQQTNATQKVFVLRRKKGGVYSKPLGPNGSPNENNNRLLYTSTLDQSENVRLVTSTYYGNNVYIELYRNGTLVQRYFDKAGSQISTPGSIGIIGRDCDVEVTNVEGGWMRLNSFDTWDNADNTKVVTNGGWIATYARVVGGNGDYNGDAVSGNNVDSGDYVEFNTNRPALNPPNLRVAVLPHGTSEISFRYQKNSGSNAVLRVQRSTTGGPSSSDWTTMSTISIPNTDTASHSYTLTTNLANNTYVRIMNDTNLIRKTSARVKIGWVRVYPRDGAGLAEDFLDSVANNWSNQTPGGPWRVKNYKFYRPGYTGAALAFKVETAPYELRDSLELESSWTLYKTYSGFTNSHYAAFSEYLKMPNRGFVRVKHTTGAGSLVIDNIGIQSWHGVTTNNAGWRAAEAWVNADKYKSPGRSLELRQSRRSTIPASVQYFRTPILTNGIGNISFYYASLTGTDTLTFKVQRCLSGDTNAWVDIEAVTNKPAAWEPYSKPVQIPGNPIMVRILHTSTNADACMLIDDFKVTDRIALDDYTWAAYNALITPKQTDKLNQRVDADNVRGAYLNYGPGIYADTPFKMTNAPPYIQSSLLTNGIGEISFWYRNWGSPYGSATIRIAVAPSLAATGWLQVATIPNVTSTEFKRYELSLFDLTNRYVRIYCSTNLPAGRACLDDVLITSPFGADVRIRNARTSPQIPTSSDPVYLTAELYNLFLLQPANIAVTSYYHIGETPWGTWARENPLRMTLVAVTNSVYYYRTVSPIPAQPIDQVVQYYAEASFTGLHSDKSSPRTYKGFTNPSWYGTWDAALGVNSQVDLNAGKSKTNPYFIAFSSLPGKVWINEINIDDVDYPIVVTQYVEVAGQSGIDIGDWKVEVYDNGNPPARLKSYTVAKPTVLANEHNGYGFWVLADDHMTSGRDMAMSPLGPSYTFPFSNTALPIDGGVILKRNRGIVDSKLKVCFGYGVDHMIAKGWQYAGDDWIETCKSLHMKNAVSGGGTVDDFTWIENFSKHTPNAVNINQTLVVQNKPTYTVTPIFRGNGTVTPASAVTVQEGGTTNFVLRATRHYHISNAKTNGGGGWVTLSYPYGNSFTNATVVWNNIRANGSLDVTFAENLWANGTPETYLARYYPLAPTNQYNALATGDTDADTFAGWQEWIVGTDPTSARSALRIIRQGSLNSSNWVTWVYGTNGLANPFAIYRSTNFVSGSPDWKKRASVSRNSTATSTWWDVSPPAGRIIYYDVRATNSPP